MRLLSSPVHTLSGTIELPGDKSISHRGILFASLANGTSNFENFLSAGVIDVMLKSLTTLGVKCTREKKNIAIIGRGIGGYDIPECDLYCGNSATTFRLLTGALASAGTPAVLDGSQGLRARPMLRIIKPLRQMGVPVTATRRGTAPIRLGSRNSSRPLQAMDYSLPIASAQAKSCLLLAALSANGDVTIREPGPSRDHTERMLGEMGVNIRRSQENDQYVIVISPAKELKPINFVIPGDISSAAFLIVAALIVQDSEIVLKGVGLNPTRTGLVDALISMGADITVIESGQQGGEPVGDLIIRSSKLSGTHIGGELVVRMIDEFPIFSIAAAYAEGKTVVEDAGELRYKESDRIAMLCNELRAIGVNAAELPDGFVIDGNRKICGGPADPHGDHRLAMSLVVAGLGSEEPISVSGAEYFNESFPGFVESLNSLGANLEIREA
jgi:3-phosphoshikimate 1-carboxyvinyltransferase